jgi:hypothetical protein
MLKIYPLYFFISLGIGFFFVYIMTPKPQVVLKFPSPLNAGKIKYKDKLEGCFVFDAANVSCPIDQSTIKYI